ncbi:MAG: 30S ribosomal protein S17 [Patescibacteria group bacterium]
MDNPILKGKMLTGTVVSDKMMKTVVVEVTRLKLHPKYKKQFKVSTKYKAHDAEQQYHIGDKVVIRETRPISKDKKWVVESKV